MNMNWYKHLKTINHHKWLVMKNCFRVGLYKQGLLHDLSKYSWTEFSVGVKYYQGDRSPNDAEREDKGYTSAWLHHKGRNKHHLEYWVDYSMDRSGALAGCKMPEKYVVEMFCDRIAASKNYNKEKYNDSYPLEYFRKGKARRNHLLHPETDALLESLLVMLAEKEKIIPLTIYDVKCCIIKDRRKSRNKIVIGSNVRLEKVYKRKRG